MPLSVEQIEVASFETTAAEADAVAQPWYTAPEPNCYSPFCIPTALPDQCPETGTVAA
ncbi:MAG TPA: hypothetical protein VFJ82_16540 [Longimicrobium sp.]|nr:hypothetical protein [Longimicrobium sp.]